MGIEGFTCNLKQYRQQKDMTQEQLANAVGVRRETIMRLEKAQYNPSLKLAIDISRAVGAPIEEIFIFDEWLHFYYTFCPIPNLPLCEEDRKRIHPVLVPDRWPGDGPEESLLFLTLS